LVASSKIRVGIPRNGSEYDEFCYSWIVTIKHDGGCEREIMIRLGKANSVFGKNLGESNHLHKGQVRLYETLILAVLLFGA